MNLLRQSAGIRNARNGNVPRTGDIARHRLSMVLDCGATGGSPGLERQTIQHCHLNPCDRCCRLGRYGAGKRAVERPLAGWTSPGMDIGLGWTNDNSLDVRNVIIRRRIISLDVRSVSSGNRHRPAGNWNDARARSASGQDRSGGVRQEPGDQSDLPPLLSKGGSRHRCWTTHCPATAISAGRTPSFDRRGKAVCQLSSNGAVRGCPAGFPV